MLKLNYPLGLGPIYIGGSILLPWSCALMMIEILIFFAVNPSQAFMFTWNLIKPFLPQKAIRKTIFVSQSKTKEILFEAIGRESLERRFGGERDDINLSEDAAFNHYLSSGFWKLEPISSE